MKIKSSEEVRKEWYRNRLKNLYQDLKTSSDPELPVILQEIEAGFYRKFGITKPAEAAEKAPPAAMLH